MRKFIAGNISWQPLNSILRLCSSWLTFSQVHLYIFTSLPLHMESDVITIASMVTIVAINHNCRNANHNCRKKHSGCNSSQKCRKSDQPQLSRLKSQMSKILLKKVSAFLLSMWIMIFYPSFPWSLLNFFHNLHLVSLKMTHWSRKLQVSGANETWTLVVSMGSIWNRSHDYCHHMHVHEHYGKYTDDELMSEAWDCRHWQNSNLGIACKQWIELEYPCIEPVMRVCSNLKITPRIFWEFQCLCKLY